MQNKHFSKVRLEQSGSQQNCYIDGTQVLSITNLEVKLSDESIPQVTLSFLTNNIEIEEIDAELRLSKMLKNQVDMAKN